MTDNRYNGWSNYATWRVNLEIFDVMTLRDMAWHRLDIHDLAETFKEYTNELLETNAKEGLALDYARAFISDVNWYEIAAHMLETVED